MTKHLCQNPNVMAGMVDGTAVLFNLEDRQLHSLNETAAACWDLLKTPSTESLVISAISQTYKVDGDDIGGDVSAVLDYFRSAGLCGAVGDFQDLARNMKSEPITLSRKPTSSMIGPFSALGVPIVVDVDDQDIGDRLAKILAPLALDKPHRPESPHESCDVMIDIVVRRERNRWSVSTNGQPGVTFGGRQATIRHVIATINSKPVDYIDDAVVFHAAAAEFGAGISIFPGVSNAGKSTLITQLVERGYKYVSDEAVAVNAVDHCVVAYPKSISIDPGSQELLQPLTGIPQTEATIDVDPRTIGAGRISTGGTVTRIIFPEYRRSAPTVLEPLSPFDAFTRLLANSFCFDTAGQAAFDAVVSLANNVAAFALTHSGTDCHLELIEALVPQSTPVMRMGSSVRE